MYNFLTGPAMWISVIICVGGLAVRIVQLMKLSGKIKPLKKEKGKKSTGINFKSNFKLFFQKTDRTILTTQPLLAILSFIYHFCLIITPVFLLAHNVIFFESWGFNLFTFPESVSDILTAALIVCGIIFLLRRILVPEVRAVTGIFDYILLLIIVAPFITGFLAHHQFFDYDIVMIMHIISGQLMLIAIGVTKLGHMVFFFFSRFLMGGEYGFNAGSRVWVR